MKTFTKIALFATLAAATLTSCVQSREPRNGVFNENVYLRKDFLIRSGDGDNTTDPGWMLKATIISTSSPNPFGDLGIVAGYHSMGELVRFRVLQDHLDMLDMQELSNVESTGRVPEVVNSWGATNVDLKYQISLDGEKTNFYQENQELPWEQRQWLKLNLAKNDLSDIAAMGPGWADMLNHCADIGESSSVLAPESVVVDDAHGYLQWTVQITVPIRTDLEECSYAYGDLAQPAYQLNRPNVTFNLMYSMVRADPAPTYKPLPLAEKDPIRHKYGAFTYIKEQRDDTSGMLAAQELVQRFDPEKPIVWYFDKGFPEKYKSIFTGPGGIKEQTNQIFEKAGVAARLDFKNYDQDMPTDLDPALQARGREYGDVRYNFLRWLSDRDMQSFWAGVTQFVTDPRTGQTLTSDISFNDFQIKDYYVQRLDAFLQYMGASYNVNSDQPWMDNGPCSDGDTMPIIDASQRAYAAQSSLFNKMQLYLNHPIDTYGPQSPVDFILTSNVQDTAPGGFIDAYYRILPYEIFADPDMNPFVVREGGAGVYGPGSMWQLRKDDAELRQRAGDIDHGMIPYEGNTIENTSAWLRRMRELTISNQKFQRAKFTQFINQHADTPDAFSFEQIVQRDARHCVDGHWETKEEWVQSLIDTYWSQVAWHEFGHSLGLEHNFMGSVDKPNFPTYQDKMGRTHYSFYANSVMEYNAAPDRVFWHAGWAPYDFGALGWIYGNSAPDGAPGTSISGQVDATHPWKDPFGFDATTGTEKQFLFCSHQHLAYTPLCREGDMGTTPSEIIANALESYEWQYNWRNFRTYRKYWDNSGYVYSPLGITQDLRKFLSMWIYDWSTGELMDTLRRIGMKNPDPNGSDADYFAQLADKFNAEMSTSNQLVAAFHKAIIQQGSGERPFATVYDKYYGDVTQEGIILDKLFAMIGWVGMWPTDNYDQNQAGAWFASYSGLGDASYASVAEDAVDSMVGGQYNVYPYFRPLAVTQFAMDTHDPSYCCRLDVRDWTGGQPFSRLEDFLSYFRNIAVQNNYISGPNEGNCDAFDTCLYDPRNHSDSHHEFIAPDKRVYIWSFVPDRNQYIAVQKDRNTASYVIVRSFNDDVVNQLDDGSYPGNAYGLELPMKYFMDSFQYYR